MNADLERQKSQCQPENILEEFLRVRSMMVKKEKLTFSQHKLQKQVVGSGTNESCTCKSFWKLRDRTEREDEVLSEGMIGWKKGGGAGRG